MRCNKRGYNKEREIGVENEGTTRKMKGKKWRTIFFAAAFLIMLLWKTESVMQKEHTRIYNVYCIGDSITYGKGVEEEQRETDSYPAILGRLLGAHYKVYNYGVSGKTLLKIPGKSYRDTGYIEALKIQHPDILIVMLGSNDSRMERWDALEYKKEYFSLITELQQIESKPDIYMMVPPEAFPLKDGKIIYGICNDVIRDEIGRIIREVAAETGVKVIDLYRVTENHPEYFFDGVHPNKEGYTIVAKAIYQQIEKIE